MTAEVPLVRVELRDRVAIVVLQDEARRNALTLTMVDDIVAAFDSLEGDEGVGAVIVTGAPPAFCAGADLSDLGASGRGATPAPPGSRERGLRAIYEGFLRVARSPLPTVAAVNGAAVGAGMNLALGCDVRVAAESARFDSRFAQLGIHPGGGHTWLLERALGPERAAAVALFGETLDGRAAHAAGLVWRCVPDGELLDVAVDLARRAADVPRELSVRIKQSLRAAPGHAGHDAAVTYELEPQAWSVTQPFFAERLAALRNRISSR